MKKTNKKDIFYCLIPIILFCVLIYLLTGKTLIFGSQLDWNSQHVVIPELFRTLFYETKDLLPDFALNIGSGQNIYNLSYYGFLSPIIIMSYLLPKVSMSAYIIVSTIITVIISIILLYIFLRKHKFNSEISLLSTIIFVTSSCISFHSHRHIMFINYMPFLLLGLFGVDKKLDKNKGWLLTLSTFLMIMTSYYFSIGGILTLIIYGIYKYLRSMKKVTFKSFMKTGISFLLPIIIAIFMSGILIVPTFMTLINNRADSNITITLKDLFTIIKPRQFLYYHYGLGLTAIIIPAMISIFKKKKEYIFLGITLTLIAGVPIFNYILNGTMYIDSKSLIPLLPLYIFIIAKFLNNLFENKLNFKILVPLTILLSIFVCLSKYKTLYFIADITVLLILLIVYKLFNKKHLFIIPFTLLAFFICFFINKIDNYTLKDTYMSQTEQVSNKIDLITDNDLGIYRISNNMEIAETPNNNYRNPRYYYSTIYSSLSNQAYNKFYYDVINNNIPNRNRALTVTNENIFSLMFLSNKYIVSRAKELHGYELVYEDEQGIKIYKNENVLPIGYATSNVMSYEDFEKLPSDIASEALLNVIVADTKSNNDFVHSIKNTNIEFVDLIGKENVKVEDNNSITFQVESQSKFQYKLPKEYQNKILFISFDMNKNNSCEENDQVIQINNVRNKLTCSSWKYHNGNKQFNYVLAQKDLTKLNITFNEGKYNISNFKLSAIDPASIESVSTKLDEFDIDEKNTKGDYISGMIDVTENGYFTLSIPYDKGFDIKVDGEKIDYEKVNTGFIGFKIEEGNHDIYIEYKAPYKKVSLVLSISGFILFIFVTFLEYKRKF